MTPLSRWIFAAKPASWPKLLVPFLLGQAIGLGAREGLDLRALAFGLLFTVLDLLFIVFLNDFGDREVDAIKRRMFPQASKKTIPDGILGARHLLIAGTVAGTGAALVAFAAEHALERPGLFILGVVSLSIFVAYTFAPLKLNYRGGGEALEMIGVGIVMPILHAYLQGGSRVWSTAPGVAFIPGFAVLALASAIASGLADERSDRRGNKRTLVVLLGNALARRVIEVLLFSGAALWLIAGVVLEQMPLPFALAPALVTSWYAVAAVSRSSAALTDAFDAQRHYKDCLHRAIWRGALLTSVLLAWWHLQ